MQYTLVDARATTRFGGWLATKLSAGQVVSLEGPLGAGKTTLLQGLAKGLGIRTPVTSPTFILFRLMPLPRARRGIRYLVHGDAYRVRSAHELIAAGLQDFLGEPSTLTIIEWGDRVRRVLPRGSIRIRLRTVERAGQPQRVISYPDRFGRPRLA